MPIQWVVEVHRTDPLTLIRMKPVDSGDCSIDVKLVFHTQEAGAPKSRV
ncbi:MAG: hypothetical protein V4734_09745 [Terriglobus sp.]